MRHLNMIISLVITIMKVISSLKHYILYAHLPAIAILNYLFI